MELFFLFCPHVELERCNFFCFILSSVISSLPSSHNVILPLPVLHTNTHLHAAGSCPYFFHFRVAPALVFFVSSSLSLSLCDRLFYHVPSFHTRTHTHTPSIEENRTKRYPLYPSFGPLPSSRNRSALPNAARVVLGACDNRVALIIERTREDFVGVPFQRLQHFTRVDRPNLACLVTRS